MMSLASHHDAGDYVDAEGLKQPDFQPQQPTRRDALRQSAAALATASYLASSQPASALPALASFSNPFAPSANSSSGGKYIPAKRCTAYLVDATIPPSLIPYRASREAAILKNLGNGRGTPNRHSWRTTPCSGASRRSKRWRGRRRSEQSGPNYQSFVFLGANFDDTYTASVEKAERTGTPAWRSGCWRTFASQRSGGEYRRRSGQGALDAYLASGGSGRTSESWSRTSRRRCERRAGRTPPADSEVCPKKRCALLALAPENADLATVKKGGLQSLDPQRREAYVADAQGFIALTQEPKFKLYTDKSLLKDFVPSASAKDEAAQKAEQGNFFAERILVHEACATAISKWASSPTQFARGYGRSDPPTSAKFLNPDSLVDDESVTTILLNPNAKETLSESKFLRLEIGTAPNNWTYQTKVADYLWFSSMPKVNMLPRMMNEM
ncbi:hypothetical protein ACHAXT_012453 [Thalassiosira profunda]